MMHGTTHHFFDIRHEGFFVKAKIKERSASFAVYGFFSESKKDATSFPSGRKEPPWVIPDSDNHENDRR